MMAPPAGALAGAAARRAGAVAGHVAPGDEPAGRPPFRAGGRLAVRDARTGDEHEVAVTAGGTLSGADLRKITPPPGTDVAWGLRVYDPGYVNTVAVRSKVSYIDGGRGVLRYRGYPIEELAENSSFLETAYLVIYGPLPSRGTASTRARGGTPCATSRSCGSWARRRRWLRRRTTARRAPARRPHSRAWDTPRASCTCSTPPRTAARATGPTPDWPRRWTSCLCCMRSTR